MYFGWIGHDYYRFRLNICTNIYGRRYWGLQQAERFFNKRLDSDKFVTEALSLFPDLPFIFITGFSERIDELKAKQIGVRHYLEKPLDKMELAMAVRNVLDEKVWAIQTGSADSSFMSAFSRKSWIRSTILGIRSSWPIVAFTLCMFTDWFPL